MVFLFPFRVDQRKENFIGAICGLGLDKFTGEPAMPDHDMEVAFDTRITLEDILKVSCFSILYLGKRHSAQSASNAWTCICAYSSLILNFTDQWSQNGHQYCSGK